MPTLAAIDALPLLRIKNTRFCCFRGFTIMGISSEFIELNRSQTLHPQFQFKPKKPLHTEGAQFIGKQQQSNHLVKPKI